MRFAAHANAKCRRLHRTRDNDTTLGWHYRQNLANSNCHAVVFSASSGNDIVWDMTACLRFPRLRIARPFVPLQDLMILGNRSADEFPGKPGGNEAGAFTADIS